MLQIPLTPHTILPFPARLWDTLSQRGCARKTDFILPLAAGNGKSLTDPYPCPGVWSASAPAGGGRCPRWISLGTASSNPPGYLYARIPLGMSCCSLPYSIRHLIRAACHSHKENGKRRLVGSVFSFGYGKGAACLPRLGGWCSVVIPYSGWTMCPEVGRLLMLCLSPGFLLSFLASGVSFRLGHTHDLYNTFRAF